MKPTPQAEAKMEEPPAKATPGLHVPVTAIFLILFGLGAFLHMSDFNFNFNYVRATTSQQWMMP